MCACAYTHIDTRKRGTHKHPHNSLSDAELDTQLQALWERQASLIGQGCEEEMDGLFEDNTVDLRCITEGLCGIAVADGDDGMKI